MQVDRKRFLALAASIAACSSGQVGLDGPITVAAPSELSPGATGDEPLPNGEANDEEPTVGLAGGDDDALRRQCRTLKPPPGPHCESFEDTKLDCETYADALEEDAAQRATHCLVQRSGREAICRYEALQDCFRAALRSADPDPAARSRCTSLVSGCASARWSAGDLTLSSCTRAFAAVKTRHESLLASCIAEGCSIGGCIWEFADR